MKSQPQMIEGQEAAERFTRALKTVLAVQKSALPSPFGKRGRGKTRRQQRQISKAAT
jgi:hypothetical protein